ncbi:MBL fold metallo-hydrolase [Chloroflexota bacterium]
MKIKWLGHASFLITSDTGTKVITDPYVTGGNLCYGDIEESADIVTVSHEHFDHNNVAAVQGNPESVRGATPVEIKGIKFNGIPTYHDENKGSQRGKNTIFCFEIDGVRICHLGDLGHSLGDKEIAELSGVDVLLIPVGGFYTIDSEVAGQLCDRIKPRVIIPMHYRNDRCPSFPVSGVAEFLQGKAGVSMPDASEVEFKRGELPASTQIIVLKSAL